jgi:hypothetical protein
VTGNQTRRSTQWPHLPADRDTDRPANGQDRSSLSWSPDPSIKVDHRTAAGGSRPPTPPDAARDRQRPAATTGTAPNQLRTTSSAGSNTAPVTIRVQPLRRHRRCMCMLIILRSREHSVGGGPIRSSNACRSRPSLSFVADPPALRDGDDQPAAAQTGQVDGQGLAGDAEPVGQVGRVGRLPAGRTGPGPRWGRTGRCRTGPAPTRDRSQPPPSPELYSGACMQPGPSSG